METLLPLISLITLCLSAAGLYLLYRSLIPGKSKNDSLQSPAWMQERKRLQRKWGMGLLMAGFAGGVIVLFLMA